MKEENRIPIARQESLKQKTPRIRNRSTSTFAAIFFQPNRLYLHLANLGITTRVNFDKSDMVVMTDFKIFMDNGKEFFQEIHLAG